MVGRLLLLFLVVPLAELYLLLRFADVTGIPTTIVVVVLTGIVGSTLAARQGVAAIRNFQSAIGQGRAPGTEVVDGILIAFAAALLLTPGLLTDAVGISLLVPWSRHLIRKFLVKRYAGRFQVVTFRGGAPQGDDNQTVDATFHRKADGNRLPS